VNEPEDTRNQVLPVGDKEPFDEAHGPEFEGLVDAEGAVRLTLDFIDPETATFERAQSGALMLNIKDKVTYLDVRIRKAFPVTYPEHYIEVRDRDNKYIGMIHSLSALTDENRHRVLEEIEKSYIIPVVTSIQEMRMERGSLQLTVTTNRGPATLYVFHAHENVMHLSDGRLRVTDALENIYEIRPWALDPMSLSHIEKIL